MTFRRMTILLVWFLVTAGFSAGISLGSPERGQETMSLFGGSTGNVPFPHHLHQTALEDCTLCHSVFGQETGVIDRLKAEKKLKKKQVMNKQCIKCHRQKKKAGLKTGPTSCKKCHIKS